MSVRIYGITGSLSDAAHVGFKTANAVGPLCQGLVGEQVWSTEDCQCGYQHLTCTQGLQLHRCRLLADDLGLEPSSLLELFSSAIILLCLSLWRVVSLQKIKMIKLEHETVWSVIEY